jgi:hypothetical protein
MAQAFKIPRLTPISTVIATPSDFAGMTAGSTIVGVGSKPLQIKK